MIGKIGSDMHGSFLKKTLEQEGICTDYIVEDGTVFTTLAFVAINENGERRFSFAREPGADTCLSASELNCQVIRDCKIFHFGSLSLTDEPARTATIEAVKTAKAAGAISFDPNYRASLWKTERDALEAIRSVISYADMLKISDEESVLITGRTDYQQAADELLRRGPKLAAITLNPSLICFLYPAITNSSRSSKRGSIENTPSTATRFKYPVTISSTLRFVILACTSLATSGCIPKVSLNTRLKV